MMDLAWAYSTFLPWIEAEMRAVVCSGNRQLPGHYGMMEYHLGWADASFSPISAPSGKRIRPLLCLLACGAVGGDPRMALPAAAGLELLHNFSLIHDDIEDNSPNRRNRPTVWTLFGMPQACNSGDGMFSLAHLAFHRLRGTGVPETIVLDVLELFDETCVALTEGQYLDMAFESRLDVTLAEYFRMIAAKTGALLAASPQIGSVVAGASAEQARLYRAFGAALGRAFQLQDDLLGIWGDEAVTGKSAASDILSKKKTLPIIYALAHPRIGSLISDRYAGPAFAVADIPDILALLDESSAKSYVEDQVRISVADAHLALGSLQSHSDRLFLNILAELVDSLVERDS
jgi:geranylgeranyl diphosphate synthase type I